MDRVSNGRQTIDYYLTVTFGMSLHVEFCCCLNHFDKNSTKKIPCDHDENKLFYVKGHYWFCHRQWKTPILSVSAQGKRLPGGSNFWHTRMITNKIWHSSISREAKIFFGGWATAPPSQEEGGPVCPAFQAPTCPHTIWCRATKCGMTARLGMGDGRLTATPSGGLRQDCWAAAEGMNFLIALIGIMCVEKCSSSLRYDVIALHFFKYSHKLVWCGCRQRLM